MTADTPRWRQHNAISDLQGLIDTRILKGGTLDLTGNPLGALAYHVQIDVLRGHITNVAYNDVLGHETDSLRTLVVGVKQGLGMIAINTVPAGGVEAHELRNYENETYDLWLAEYPAETGTFDAPSNPVSITAIPTDGDGHLDYWMGSYFAYGPRDAAELSVILFEDTKLNAIIEGRPGMGALDLVADFEDFVAEVLPAQDWATLDENSMEYPGGEPVFAPNGIPDAAELGLLSAVLKDATIDFSAVGGVVSRFTWEAWEQNLALAEAQLGPAIPALSSKPYLTRIVAAYMTLGDYDSVEWINVVMDTYTGQDVLEREAFDRSKQRYFKAKADADHDAFWNIEEWEGLALTGIMAEDVAAYAEVALDREQKPSAAKGLGGMAKSSGSECPNKNCIPPARVYVINPNLPPLIGPWLQNENTLEVTRSDGGGNIAPGTAVFVPIGTKLKVRGIEDSGRRFVFGAWSAPGTLIDYSLQPEEEFYVTGNVNILAGFTRNRVVLPVNNTYTVYSVSGAWKGEVDPNNMYLQRYYLRPDETATLSGSSTQFHPAAWVLKDCQNCADPSHSRTNPITVRFATYGEINARSAEEKQASVSLQSKEGGDVTASSNEANEGRVLNSVTDGRGSAVRVDARPFDGYEFSGFTGTGPSIFSGNGALAQTSLSMFVIAGKDGSIGAVFHEKKRYSLDLEVKGDDVPCSGYVDATPAMKYYIPGEEVTLEAHELPGYKFVGWAGYAEGVDGHNLGEGETTFPVEWLDSDVITIRMTESTTVRAIFKRSGEVTSSILSDDELLPHMGDGSLTIAPAISNETAVVSFVNLKLGEEVTATIIALGPAKGHVEYDGHHSVAGRASLMGSLSGHTTSTDGGCEFHQWNLDPSEFSGEYAVKITVDGTDTLAPFTVKVPGLVPVEEGDHIYLYQSDDNKPGGSTFRKIHPGFYYVTPGFKSILEPIADQYCAIYPERPLWVNDSSLEWGGRFEYEGYWTTPHSSHRRGLETDIGTYAQYPDSEFPGEGAEQAARIADLRGIVDDEPHVFILFELGVTNHIHIRHE